MTNPQKRHIAILGSTGSIGTQAIEVVRAHPDAFEVEVLVAKPSDASPEWDIVPQLQVTLSKIQHVAIAGGVRIPLNERDERHAALVTYLLWDFFDGGFTQFWK